jgi:hypothetical protein
LEERFLSFWGLTNRIGCNRGKEEVGQDVWLAVDTVLSDPQSWQWKNDLTCCCRRSSIQNDQSALRKCGDNLFS